MKVLITNPPWTFKQHGFLNRIGFRAGSRWPFSLPVFCDWRKSYRPYPGFMGYAASYLKSKGVDVKFYDAIGARDSYQIFFKKLDEFKPEIVIQETSAPTFDSDLEIAKKIRKKGCQLALVGPQATAFSQELIKLPFVDYVLEGAYEVSSSEMVKTKRKGVYESKFIDLDHLPYPYRDKEVIHYYRDYNCSKNLAFPQLWVYASRGCVFACDFCLWIHTMFGKKYSLRSPGSILDEIEAMVSKYNFKHIYFDDDSWNIGPEYRLRQIAEGLKKIGLPWTIHARLDTSSKDSFKYFVDRGCSGLRVGVESLSQRLLDATNKGLKVETIIDKLEYLKKLDVDLFLLFMHYLPGETQADRVEQAGYLKKLGLRYQNPPCIPFPGTPYYQQMADKGFDLKNLAQWSEYDGGVIGKNLVRLVKDYSQKN